MYFLQSDWTTFENYKKAKLSCSLSSASNWLTGWWYCNEVSQGLPRRPSLYTTFDWLWSAAVWSYLWYWVFLVMGQLKTLWRMQPYTKQVWWCEEWNVFVLPGDTWFALWLRRRLRVHFIWLSLSEWRVVCWQLCILECCCLVRFEQHRWKWNSGNVPSSPWSRRVFVWWSFYIKDVGGRSHWLSYFRYLCLAWKWYVKDIIGRVRFRSVF